MSGQNFHIIGSDIAETKMDSKFRKLVKQLQIDIGSNRSVPNTTYNASLLDLLWIAEDGRKARQYKTEDLFNIVY